MPLPLPWFNNQVDPLLPANIKPLLYLYDQYQTYDLVEWSQLTPNWSLNTFPIDFLNYKTFGEVFTILVERFTPWDYEWAEHYSTKIFNFIYNYTGTEYDRISGYNYITGLFYDYTSGHQWQGEFFYEHREDYISNEQVVLNIPVTQQQEIIIITWLEYDYLDMASSKINNALKAILAKRYKKITTSNQNWFTLAFNLSSIALCSVVVSSSNDDLALNIKQQLNSQRGILYDNLDDILSELRLKLVIAFPRLFKVISSMTYQYNLDIQVEGGRNGANLNASFGGNQYDSYIMGDLLQNATFTYRERPEYYRSGCLLYANNNYWQNGSIYNDLGKTPNFFINPFLPQEYQPPYPSHDLLYIENLNFPDTMSEIKKRGIIPGITYYGGSKGADGEIEFAFVGQPRAYTYGNLLKTTRGEKHYTYQTVSVPTYTSPDPQSAQGFYDVYKFYCILTHEGDGIISIEGGGVEYLGRNNDPLGGEVFKYSDFQTINVIVNYHYFEHDNNSGDSTNLFYRTPLSDEAAIALIDNYLYQSSVAGEFDNA